MHRPTWTWTHGVYISTAYTNSLQLYRFLARRTDSRFNRVILRRLFMSKVRYNAAAGGLKEGNSV